MLALSLYLFFAVQQDNSAGVDGEQSWMTTRQSVLEPSRAPRQLYQQIIDMVEVIAMKPLQLTSRSPSATSLLCREQVDSTIEFID